MRKPLFITLICLLASAPIWSQVRVGGFLDSQDKLEVSYANPKTYEIGGLEVTGATFLDKNALISLTGLKIGDKVKVPGDALTGALKKLYGQGIIEDVSINLTKVEDGKAFLEVVVKERPRLRKVVYKGVNKTQEGELSDKIDLIIGKVVTDALMKNTEFAVKNHFVSKGYLNTSVVVSQLADSLLNNSVNLLVEVTKNSKVKINKIHIAGNEQLSANKLKSKMKSTNEHVRVSIFKDVFNRIFRVNPKRVKQMIDSSYEVSGKDIKSYINDNVKLNFFNGSKYVKNDYQDDKKALIEFYNSKGFRDATIVSDSIVKVGDKHIDVVLKVDEGDKYYFRNIDWVGNFVHEDRILRAVLGVEKGDAYDLEKINERLNFNPTGPDISSLYMDNGYLFFNVQPVEVKIEEDSIDIEMRVFEGTQATISKIIINGNDRTSDHVIRREIRTLPGDKFNRSLLIRTQRELSQMGYFDPEQIGLNPIPNPQDGTVDIEYSLVERPSDQIELSGGWGGNFGFVGTLGLVFNNFSVRNIPNIEKWRPLPVGDGQRLALRIQANGKQFQNYSLTFSEPWLGGKKPNSLSVSLSHAVQRRIVNFFTNETRGKLQLSSVTVGLGRRVKWPDDYFTLSNSISFQNYVLEDFPLSRLGFADGDANSFTFNTTIARNSIDAPMFPREGSSLSLNIALTPPYSLWRNLDYENASSEERFRWVEYHKVMFDASYFVTLAGNLVLNARGHLGFLGSYTEKAGIGPFERFYLGGDGLGNQSFGIIGTDQIGLRGYENQALTPPRFNANSRGVAGDVDGGVAFTKYVMELRYPVSLNPSATIFVLGFLEAGNNFYTFDEYDPFKTFKSAGFGARIFMPAFGLLGIDWAYGFDTVPGQLNPSGSQFHFSIGQPVR